MAKEYNRAQRVGELIQRELALLMQRELRPDKKLGLVTIASVEVTPDLKTAHIYFTLIGETCPITEAVEYLNQKAGLFRHHLAQQLTLRITPQLQFNHDDSIEHARRLTALINSLQPAPHLTENQQNEAVSNPS